MAALTAGWVRTGLEGGASLSCWPGVCGSIRRRGNTSELTRNCSTKCCPSCSKDSGGGRGGEGGGRREGGGGRGEEGGGCSQRMELYSGNTMF